MASRAKYGLPTLGKDDVPQGSRVIANTPDQKGKVILHADGTLEAKNLRETSSDGLSFHLDESADQLLFTKELDANTECQYVPKHVDKVYKTTVTFKDEVKEAFAVYKNDVRRFAVETMDRYKKSPKPLKKKIDAIHKAKNQYIFTEQRSNALWNQAYVDGTTLGPYNYDVELHVTKDINFINDLIVIKSGVSSGLNPTSNAIGPTKNSWGIAWVSPHIPVVNRGDAVYTLTGTRYFQNNFYITGSGAEYLSGTTSFQKEYGVGNNVACHTLTSSPYRISAGQTISSGTVCDNVHNNTSVSNVEPLQQDFYYLYDNKVYEHSGKLNTGGWNGVIPSGTWFTIETWSTNPRYIGFDGEITVKPTGAPEFGGTDPTCTYAGSSQGTASDLDYQQSVRKAIKQAKKKFHRSLNKALVSKGIKNKSSRTIRYETLLERVAQNAYDGLSLVRNESISKVQGLETNPLDGPVYYDGTSKQFGGSSMTLLYNTEETYLERNSSSNSTNSGGTGSTSSSSGGSSTY